MNHVSSSTDPTADASKQAGFRQSALLTEAGFRHAFFNRHGGVSTGPYRSLNFSYAATDSRENVQENLDRAARALGVPPEHVYFLSQVHGTDVHCLVGGEDREQILHETGDALVSLSPTLACGVRSADCVPILLADRTSGGVGALHAGWRGTVLGVVSSAVKQLTSLASARSPGAEPDLIAAIGPHISVAAFEVSDDVAAELAGCSSADGAVDRSFGPKPHVNLRRILRSQLEALGLKPHAIDDVPGCTLLEPADWFSYRRDGQASGRHLSAIVARG